MDENRARRHCTPSKLGRGADFISALPTDLLLQVLVRLGCARAAARTSILSRRWRGLWTRLPKLTFRDVTSGPLLAALSSLGPSGVPLSLLDIHIPEPQIKVHVDRGPRWAGGRARRQSYRLQPLQPTNQVTMLLRAAGRLSPAAFRFSHPHELENPYVDVDLSSCFHHATSIELDARFICFPHPRSGFPALESLSLSGCVVILAVVVPLCPRLRVLRVPRAYLQGEVITVRSASLQEFFVENDIAGASTRRVDIEAPTLKQLTMLFRNSGDLSVSVLAPDLEKVSWRCIYSGVRVGIGLWGLSGVSLQTKERNGQGLLPPVHIFYLLTIMSFPKIVLAAST
ncbi:hypothetical protein CFC21_059595 [Triticum aestivum]|uniref:F-box domain-containing protein n=2 Tax=Triticum aestivum TaxID=4565 RepID=A0A9R1GR21_WHEAT|nr:hypothetical protein CFC21_059595 [Triticum aestivum]